MPIHRTAAMPVAGDELARIRSTLARQYGATVLEEDTRRVLVIRVPRDQPDPVNDVEGCIEYLAPEDVEDIRQCILVGDETAAQVYAAPIQELMRQRLDFDRRQCKEWRQRMPGKLGHTLYQSPEDPRRRWRLAVRIPVASVKELEEEHLDALADGLGPQLESQRFQALAAVYLIAGDDDVRLEPDMFVQQLLEAWNDEERRRRLELELAQKREAERRRKEAERGVLLRELDRRFKQRVARAPVRSGPGTESAHPEATRPAGALTDGGARRGHGDPGAPRDAGIGGQEAPRTRRRGRDGTAPDPVAEVESTVHAGPPKVREVRDRVRRLNDRVEGAEAKQGLQRIQRRLEEAGFDVLLSPETPGHTLDVAAERPGGDPQRVVVRIVDRLDSEVARELMKTARELEVDVVLCVAAAAEPEAQRLLVATKVKRLHPDALDSFRF